MFKENISCHIRVTRKPRISFVTLMWSSVRSYVLLLRIARSFAFTWPILVSRHSRTFVGECGGLTFPQTMLVSMVHRPSTWSSNSDKKVTYALDVAWNFEEEKRIA